MNLRALANSYTTAVNPNIVGDYYKSAGSTQGANFRRTPDWAPFPGVAIQVQAISGGAGSDGPELQHTDSLNIQGEKRAVWFNGDVQANNRVTVQGGDVFYFVGKWWLVVQLVETWDEGGWSHFIVQAQNGKPAGIP